MKYYVGLAGNAIEVAGVLIIAVGCLFATIRFCINLRQQGLDASFSGYRIVLGRVILMGLELLLAGDIIRTVVITPTLEQVGVLAIIVLIRTFLSFTLELEIEGKWPWQRVTRSP